MSWALKKAPCAGAGALGWAVPAQHVAHPNCVVENEDCCVSSEHNVQVLLPCTVTEAQERLSPSVANSRPTADTHSPAGDPRTQNGCSRVCLWVGSGFSPFRVLSEEAMTLPGRRSFFSGSRSLCISAGGAGGGGLSRRDSTEEQTGGEHRRGRQGRERGAPTE